MQRRTKGFLGVFLLVAGLAVACDPGGSVPGAQEGAVQRIEVSYPGEAEPVERSPGDPADTRAGTVATAQAGDVIISEIMANPKCVTDAKGEWLELRNATAADLSLKGWGLADEGQDRMTLGELVLPAKGFVVLCRNLDVTTNGGVTCQGALKGFPLANSADEVVLTDPTGRRIDSVAYDGKTFPKTDGASLALKAGNDASSNDAGANWVASDTASPGGCGDRATPGAANFDEGDVEEPEPPACDPAACDDRNPCTADDCDAEGQCIHVVNNRAPCDDGDSCTSPDTCQDGLCVGGPDTCPTPTRPKDIVVMIYQDGDNNLDPDAMKDLREMEAAGVDSVPWLHVYTLLDRASNAAWSDTRLYQVHSGSSTELAAPRLGLTVGSREELNMGDPKTLVTFLEEVREISPAGAEYYLILWNHGSGWRTWTMADDPGATLKEVCVDDTNGDSLLTRELSQALGGKGLALIGFDACLEGMAEVAYELRNDAKIMVASEETEPGSGWDYTGLLQGFASLAEPTPEQFGRLVADTYMETSSYADMTMAVYELSRMAAVATAATGMAKALADVPESTWSALCQEAEWFVPSAHYQYPNADFGYLARRAAVRDAARAATYDAAADAIAAAVLYETHRSDHPDSTGMAIYFPCDVTLDSNYNATQIRWAADTWWDEMLEARQ